MNFCWSPSTLVNFHDTAAAGGDVASGTAVWHTSRAGEPCTTTVLRGATTSSALVLDPTRPAHSGVHPHQRQEPAASPLWVGMSPLPGGR